MKSPKSFTLKLSAAVLAAGVIVSSAGAAQAAPALAASAAKSAAAANKATLLKAAKLSTDMANADTVADVTAALAKAGNKDPQLTALFKAMPKNGAVNTQAGEENAGPSSTSLLRAVAARATAAAEGTDPGLCPEGEATAWLLDTLELRFPDPDTTSPEDMIAFYDRMAKINAVLMTGVNAPVFEAVWNGPDIKALTRFGEEQDKTKVITQVFKKVKGFWDTDFGKITDSAMKDDLMTKRGGNSALKVRAYAIAALTDGKVGELDPREVTSWPAASKAGALELGKYLQETIDAVPQFDGGEHPVFTFNAFAFNPAGKAQTEAHLPKRYVFGDGLLSYLRVFKYGDTGVGSIIGHEMGHHIQFVDGSSTSEPTSWENGRDDELEADYYGNYYAGHKLGGNYTKAQSDLAIKLFGEMGDCSIGDNGHHGTMQQRREAATQGFALAATQKKNGHVFAAESVRLKFNKALPSILAAK